MEVEKGYHCAYQIHYHIVFPVKYRKGLLREDVVKVIKEVSAGLEERYGLMITGASITVTITLQNATGTDTSNLEAFTITAVN